MDNHALTTKAKKKIWTYLGILMALSCVFYWVILRAGGINANGGLYVLGLMWCPGVAGMLTQLIYEHSLRGLGWKPGRFKYLALAYALPLGYCLISYGITWASGLGKFPNTELLQQISEGYGIPITNTTGLLGIYVGLTATIGLISGLISGLGEEIGWRGLFVPELAKLFSYRTTVLISGAVWTLWHLPMIVFGGYTNPDLPVWYAVLMFTIMVMGINFAFGWLRLKSGSLWPAAVLHASHNLFVQAIFTPLTIQLAITPYIIDEFGAGLAVLGLVVAFLFRNDPRKPVASNVEVSLQA